MSKKSPALASRIGELIAILHEATAVLAAIELVLRQVESFEGIEEPLQVAREACVGLSRQALWLAQVCDA